MSFPFEKGSRMNMQILLTLQKMITETDHCQRYQFLCYSFYEILNRKWRFARNIIPITEYLEEFNLLLLNFSIQTLSQNWYIVRGDSLHIHWWHQVHNKWICEFENNKKPDQLNKENFQLRKMQSLDEMKLILNDYWANFRSKEEK